MNLLNTPLALWLPAAANAFNIFLLKRFFDSRSRGDHGRRGDRRRGPLRALWTIVLPMSRPILGVVSIFSIVAVWKDFLWPLLVMQSPETQTLSVGSAGWRSQPGAADGGGGRPRVIAASR